MKSFEARSTCAPAASRRSSRPVSLILKVRIMQRRRCLAHFPNPAMEDIPGSFRRFAGVNRFRDGFRLRQPACWDMLFPGPQARGAEKRLQAYDQTSCAVVVGCVGRRAHFTGSIRRVHRSDNFTCIDDSFHLSRKLNRLMELHFFRHIFSLLFVHAKIVEATAGALWGETLPDVSKPNPMPPNSSKT